MHMVQLNYLVNQPSSGDLTDKPDYSMVRT